MIFYSSFNQNSEKVNIHVKKVLIRTVLNGRY